MIRAPCHGRTTLKAFKLSSNLECRPKFLIYEVYCINLPRNLQSLSR